MKKLRKLSLQQLDKVELGKRPLANKGFLGKRARHRFEKYYSLNTMRLKVTQLYNSE